jgi:fatty-acid desaturase
MAHFSSPATSATIMQFSACVEIATEYYVRLISNERSITCCFIFKGIFVFYVIYWLAFLFSPTVGDATVTNGIHHILSHLSHSLNTCTIYIFDISQAACSNPITFDAHLDSFNMERLLNNHHVPVARASRPARTRK